MKHIDDLPTEILLHILSFLSLRHLFAVEHVSLRWRAVFDICLSRLRDFTMGWPHHITNQCLQLLLPRMSTLRIIDIDVWDRETNYTRMNKLDLHIVSHHCPHLTELNLSAFRVCEPSLQRLCLRCPRLEAVTVNPYCTDDCLKVIVLNQRRLRALTVRSPETRCRWLSLLPESLQRLSLTYWADPEPGHVRHVAQCHNLRELDLSFSSVARTSHLKEVLTGCVKLERLLLASCWPSRRYYGDSLHLEAGSGCLRELDVSDVTWITADMMSAGLACCGRLERLSAARLTAPLEDCLPPAGLPALRYLNVRRAAALTDASLRRLTALLPALQTLNISFCRDVTEDGLRCLRQLPQLRALLLAGVPCVSDALLDHLSRYRLVELELGCAESFAELVSAEAVLRCVLQCRTLRRLTLYDKLSRVRPVVEGLLGRLGADRDVTVVLYPGFPRRLPRAEGPLRLTDTTSVRRAKVVW